MFIETVSAMPGQAEDLVKRIYADPTIDVANDWKVITLFIGGNDVCEFCKDRPNYTKEKYIERITKALDHLHDKVKQLQIYSTRLDIYFRIFARVTMYA